MSILFDSRQITVPVVLLGWVAVLLCFGLSVKLSHADRVTFTDGSTLRCNVVTETTDASGNRYVQILIENSKIWIDRSAIQSIEHREETRPLSAEEANQKLQDLLNQGSAFIDTEAETDLSQSMSPASSAISSDMALVADSVKGWGYLYENQAAIDLGNRFPLKVNETIPLGHTLIASPNSRITLNIGDFGQMGILSHSQVRFDNLFVTRTQTYEIDLTLINGAFWMQLGKTEGENWKRVKLIINAAQVILQEGIIYCEALERTGAVDISYLSGNRSTKFWRSTEVPTTVNVGETVTVSPGSNRLTVRSAESAESQLEQINQWLAWQPEALAVQMQPMIPPLNTFSKYPSVPALHPYKIQIDPSMAYSPQTNSLGEILKILRDAIEKYKFDTGSYPNPERGLKALRESYKVPGWRGNYLDEAIPLEDYWGNPFVYELYMYKGNEIFDVRSMGPNGKDDKGLADDIR